MKFGADGRLYAINPEYGFFGVAPGTSMKSNANAMLSSRRIQSSPIARMTLDGDVWWEGMTEEKPAKLVDWLRRRMDSGLGPHAAHPNARFTAPAKQCPVIAPEWEDPKACPSMRFCSAGGERNCSAGDRSVQLAARHFSGSDREQRNDCSHHRKSRTAAARSYGDASVSAVTTWATTLGTGSRWERCYAVEAAEDFLR